MHIKTKHMWHIKNQHHRNFLSAISLIIICLMSDGLKALEKKTVDGQIMVVFNTLTL